MALLVLFALLYLLPLVIGIFRRHYQVGALLVGTLGFPLALYLLPAGALGLEHPMQLLPLPWAVLMVWAVLPRPVAVPKPAPAVTTGSPPTPAEALLWSAALLAGLLGWGYYYLTH